MPFVFNFVINLIQYLLVLQHTRGYSDGRSPGSQTNSSAVVQALLARQQLEEQGERCDRGGVPVPADISTSSALIQAMLARQRAEDLDEDFYHMRDNHTSSFTTPAPAMQAGERAKVPERDECYSTTEFSETPVNRSSALTQAMQARQRAEDRADDTDDLPSSVSGVMMQVMQARERAEAEDAIQWVPASPQSPAPPGSSALIQAMLARQQAQNEYDDGYWANGSELTLTAWIFNNWNQSCYDVASQQCSTVAGPADRVQVHLFMHFFLQIYFHSI